MTGSLSLAALGFLGHYVAKRSRELAEDGLERLSFQGLPPMLDPLFDGVQVPHGYEVQVVFAWGDPVEHSAPPFRGDASESAEDQRKQAGQNHDGMHFFPLDDSSDHGLLAVNHEYFNPTLHPNGPTYEGGLRPKAELDKERAAMGVSIVEIKRSKDGSWQLVKNSSYNRRIHGDTPIFLSGPLKGHDQLKTEADPEAIQVLGTLANCAMGVTPWGTYLTCEENIQDLFKNGDEEDLKSRPTHSYYHLSSKPPFDWHMREERFDATPRNRPFGGYVNEPHRFGYVVEINPYDPKSYPIKRTAMGRLIRECATLSLGSDQRMAFYMADDSRGEFLYKFVPTGRYLASNPDDHHKLLDEGVIYVAQCDENGKGQWLPLVHGAHNLTTEHGFADQADILLNTRKAARVAGGTTMDRPEWVAVHPDSKEVYVSLTNNHKRGDSEPLNPANPRKDNIHGHILRIREEDQNPTATGFEWDIYLLAGDPEAKEPEHRGNIKGDIFSSPDGLFIDQRGQLWIATDYADGAEEMQAFGCNQLLVSNPETREVKRFLVGPRGCEVTGITMNPDQSCLFVNIQHPGGSFPAGDGTSRPRSATLAIWKKDGGPLGS